MARVGRSPITVPSGVSVAVGHDNTVTVKGKSKIFRGRPGTRSDWKKAIVSLVEGHKIDVTTGL